MAKTATDIANMIFDTIAVCDGTPDCEHCEHCKRCATYLRAIATAFTMVLEGNYYG